MYKMIIPIAGMHCRSCEILIEDKLSAVPNIKKARVHYKQSVAEIFFSDQRPNPQLIDQAVREAGYRVGRAQKKPWFSKRPRDYKELGIAMLFVLGAYWLLKSFGLTSLNVGANADPSSLGVILLVGLTAGFSTCMALVGGLVLGISARHAAKHPEATLSQKFRPHLFFNLGRIGSYTLLGGVLGTAGSVLQLSSTTLGFLTIVVGGVMLLMGSKLVGIFPRLENISLTLPSSISRLLGIKKHEKEYNHKSSLTLGALTFFLPCGFTQAMQLYAISTGSFTRGSIIMGIFALGTAPGLLGIGGLTAAVKGIFAQRFFKAAGVVVVVFALLNISNGFNLTGWQLGSIFSTNVATAANDQNVALVDGVQVVRMTEYSGGYTPNLFTVTQGVPVQWIIDAQDPNSCASLLVMPKYNIQTKLTAGENVIEFTPTETGRVTFSCAMGMYNGAFEVVDAKADNNAVAVAQPTVQPAVQQPSLQPSANSGSGGSCGSGGGCGCGGGGAKKITPSAGTTETSANTSDQIIKTAYTYATDIQPNTFTVKAGSPVRFEVDVKENGSGCMSTIMIPGLFNNAQLLQAGQPLVMQFTPTKPGVYDITCAMGVPRGTLTVE